MIHTLDIQKEKRENAEVILKGTLPKDTVSKFSEKALDMAMNEVEVSGFRKGKAPKERVIEEVGKNFLWKQAAELALREEIDQILEDEQIVPIVPINTTLTKTEPDTDVPFEIVVVTPPTSTIENPQEISKNALATLPKENVEDELKEAKRAFRTQVRAISKMKNPEEVKEGDAKENEDRADEPLTDDEAKLVGFENGKAVEHFIEGEAQKAVADRSQQKKRGAVAEALISASTYNIPVVMIADEAKALVEAFKKDIVAQSMEWTEYLKRAGKTEQQLTDEFKPQAEKRIALDLVFATIMKEHQFEISEEEKKKEEEFAHKLVEQGVDHQRAHAHTHEQFLREKVWEHLGIKAETAVS